MGCVFQANDLHFRKKAGNLRGARITKRFFPNRGKHPLMGHELRGSGECCWSTGFQQTQDFRGEGFFGGLPSWAQASGRGNAGGSSDEVGDLTTPRFRSVVLLQTQGARGGFSEVEFSPKRGNRGKQETADLAQTSGRGNAVGPRAFSRLEIRGARRGRWAV